MLKKELAPGIIQYVFPPRKETFHFGDSITAIIHENKAILIDTGFENEARQVLEDLSAQGVTVDSVIISHFHDDHMYGLKLINNVPVYGSCNFQHTLDMWTDKEDRKYFTPSITIEKPTIIEFGKHTLEILPSPGHSLCTVLVKINGQFIHIADEIMYSNDGQPLLPSIESRQDIKRQLESWNLLKDYQNFTIILGHGWAFDGKNLHEDLRNRMTYASAILGAVGAITYEEAVKDCNFEFLHKNWFDHLAVE